MGAKCSSSHLSDGKYGYDFVVAMTQESINGRMLEFLESLGGQDVEMCYTMDDHKQYVSTTLEDLKKRSDGVDPFAIPDQTDPEDSRIQALKNARFIAGFRATIGTPFTDQPDLLPDIITLNQDASQVVFRALCSKFEVVALQPKPYEQESWVSKSQPRGNPWVFTVDVNLQTSVMVDREIRNLPEVVQTRIAALREMGSKTDTEFDIKHLLLNLATAPRKSKSFIDGLEKNSPIRGFLEDAFQETYVQVLTKPGNPLLGCIAVAKNSPSTPLASQVVTDFHLMVNPYVGEDGLAIPEPPEPAVKSTTLSYLCSWDGHRLPPPHKFSWNWINMVELSDHDGIVAINRTWVVNYLANLLKNFVATRCRFMNVQCDTTKGGSVHYNCEFPSYTAVVPTISSAPDAKVLSFRHKSKDQDQCGVGGCLGQLEVRYEYGMDVSFSGHTITIEQTQLLHVFLQRLRAKKSGDYIKKSWTDTFSIGVDGDGYLVVKQDIKGKQVNTSNKIPDDSSMASSAEIRSIVKKLTDVAPLASPDNSLEEKCKTALNSVHDFVFPFGGMLFYKKAEFSDFQDLLCQVTYRGPGRKVVRIPRRLPQDQSNGNGAMA